MKIIVADDEKKITEMLKNFLDKIGHETTIVYDGKDALDQIKKTNFDIAILDENMPGLSGLEIVEYIKKNKLNVKTLILTGYPFIGEDFSKMLGANEFLTKPVNLNKIEEVLNKLKASK